MSKRDYFTNHKVSSAPISILYHHQTLINTTFLNYKYYKGFYNITLNLITYSTLEETITCFTLWVISIIEKFSVLHCKLWTILSI